MTTYQRSSEVLVAIRRETTTGVVATVTGATQVRIIDSQGAQFSRAPIQSQERRTDALMQMGRLGYKTVSGDYNMEMSVGGALDIVAEAVMRSSWVPAWSAPFSSLTTVAIGTNTLTAAAGSWLTLGSGGIRVGDIFQLSSTTVTGDNSLNKLVTAVATLTLTTEAGAFTTLAATATGTITILKKLKTATSPTRYSHTIEHYFQTLDLSEYVVGCRAVGLKMSFKPGQPATAVASFQGMDRVALASGASPYFTSPTLTTNLILIPEDSTVRFNGVQVANFTGADIDFSIAAAGVPVIGALVTPDIFDNSLNVTGSITALRSDFSNLTLYDAETEFEVSIKLEEPGSSPKNCWHIFLPRVKLGGLGAPVGGGDGAQQETLTLMVGPKTAAAATGNDAGIATISSSGP